VIHSQKEEEMMGMIYRSWTCLVVLLVLNLGVSVWAQPLQPLIEQAGDEPKLQKVLISLIHAGGDKAAKPFSPASQLLSEQPGWDYPLSLKIEGDRVRVVIETEASFSAKVARQVRELGGEVELIHESWVQALLPLRQLEGLASSPEVHFIRLPAKPFLTQGSVRSEGLGVIGSESWNEAGIDGKGVKVGIIDSGFRGYRSLLGRELPPEDRVVVNSFRSDGDIECGDCGRIAQLHGLGVAEVIYDIAPGAALYLSNIDTDVSFRRAISWMIGQDVDVINTSIGFFSGCFRQGGGIFEREFAKARRSGITWATAAGNNADLHWEGAWSDPDGDLLHNYTRVDEGNTIDVQLVEYEYPDGRKVATSLITVIFSWDAPCSGASDDYEVVVMKEEGGELKPLPDWDGSVGQLQDWMWRPGVPIKFVFASEDFPAGRVGSFERYHIAVRKRRPSAPDSRFDMLIDCPCIRIEHLKPEGSVSIIEPSISPNVITVGAVHHSPDSCPRSLCPDGHLLVYSSQGPTKDGRIKPDITAPSHVSTKTFRRWSGEGSGRNSGFTGTSAASPHVAGAAALVKQAFPDFTPDEIQQFLEDRAEDMGDPGKDNRYGAGVLLLGQPPAPAGPTITGIEPASGLQGSTVDAVITGTNLEGATEVSFSGEGVTAKVREGGTDTTLPITITIAADAPPGERTFTVTTPAGTAESGEITFTVLEAPRIGVEPESLIFEAIVGQPQTPSKKLRIFNAGGGVLRWSASVDVEWLSLSQAEGTAPSEVTVSVDLSKLLVGRHEGHITITAEGALNSPLIVPVTLTLEGPSGELLALVFLRLEFLEPEDWERALQGGCVVYLNVSAEPSPVRVTLEGGSVEEYEIPPDGRVIVCGDVVHMDTRPPKG